jgi:RNA polymerase sigma-70 factor (ECF subfamily)
MAAAFFSGTFLDAVTLLDRALERHGELPMTMDPPLTPSTMSDEELVARVRAGEQRLFELIMRRHNRRVFRAARAILRDSNEAEDVMQDAYVRAYEHLKDFEGRASFGTWLTKIAVHEALARVRKRSRFQPLDGEKSFMSTQPPTSPEQKASDAEMRIVLERAIDELPHEFRSVFVLRAVEGMSGAETAECLGIPEETVKTRLYRARGRLQAVLIESIEPALSEVYDFHLSRCDRVVAEVFRRIAQK